MDLDPVPPEKRLSHRAALEYVVDPGNALSRLLAISGLGRDLCGSHQRLAVEVVGVRPGVDQVGCVRKGCNELENPIGIETIV